MSQSVPKANSRKPDLAVGTRVRAHGLDGVIVGVRKPKFARRYTLRCCDDCAPFNARRDEFEVRS